MRVLITGGAGFIGSNLVKYFNSYTPAAEVIVLDDLSTGRRENLDGSVAVFREGSILDDEALQSAAFGVDAIVHLAAIPSVPRSVAAPLPSHDANATGTLRVLEAARRASAEYVVVASSSSVYGSNPSLPKNELDWTSPMSPYGVSKLATEAYAIAYAHSYQLKTLAFRFFNVYGPGQAANHDYAAVIPKFLDSAINYRPLSVQGDGEQSRDFTYVDTVCGALHQAVLGRVTSPQPVNLAFGTNTTLIELVGEIELALGRRVELEHGPERVGDIRASLADGIRIRELFPSVEPISLRSGLAKTLAWFQQPN